MCLSCTVYRHLLNGVNLAEEIIYYGILDVLHVGIVFKQKQVYLSNSALCSVETVPITMQCMCMLL